MPFSCSRPVVNLFLSILVLSVVTGCAQFSTSPRNAGQTYANPVIAADVPDPSVKKFGNYYYVFGTTGERRMPDGRIFSLWRSTDLVHWDLLGGALVPPSNETNFQYWAPEITENG